MTSDADSQANKQGQLEVAVFPALPVQLTASLSVFAHGATINSNRSLFRIHSLCSPAAAVIVSPLFTTFSTVVRKFVLFVH